MSRWQGLAHMDTSELAEMSTAELVEEIERMRFDWYSPEDHERLVRRAEDEAEDAARDAILDDYKPLAADAHALLRDLAWRATRGEADAIATEQIAGPILRLLSDLL